MFYIVREDNIFDIQEYGKMYSFLDQKDFEQQLNSFYYREKTKFENFEPYINNVYESIQNLNTVEISRLFDGKHRKESYTNYIKSLSSMEQRQLPVVPLKIFVNKFLRKNIIRLYYKDKILKNIKDTTFNVFDIDISDNAFHPLKFAYGYIGSYRPKLLSAFETTNVYWIRMLHTEFTEGFVKNNFIPSPTTYIEYAKKTTRYQNKSKERGLTIDVLTTDISNKHLAHLALTEENCGFIVDLQPLIAFLMQHNLLHAY